MNEKAFIKEIAKRTGLSEYAINEIYNVSYEFVAENLINGNNVKIPKMGLFYLSQKKAKNLFGKPEDSYELCFYPSFKISDRLKNRVKNGQKYQKMT